jgi:hypothetical protein
MGAFDSVDDELFAIDYRAECHASALIMPEPSTVRLEERTPRLVRPDMAGPPPAPERAGDSVLVIAFAGALVLVLASFGVVLWWWTG